MRQCQFSILEWAPRNYLCCGVGCWIVLGMVGRQTWAEASGAGGNSGDGSILCCVSFGIWRLRLWEGRANDDGYYSMGFSTGVLSCALIRGFAGLMSASTRVMVWTMLGDVSNSTNAKAKNFSRMPLIATGGVIGPLLQALLAHRFSDNELWKKFPILSSQLACAGLMMVFFVVNFVFLKETLPNTSRNTRVSEFEDEPYRDRISEDSVLMEKDSFLGQVSIKELPRRLSYTYNDTPKPITFSQAIRAPSLIILLCSFSFLSLHSASFDQLLPILGNSSVENGGLGLPCSFLALVVLGASSASAIITYIWFSRSIERLGLLNLYRVCCWAFPLIYILTPIISGASASSQTAILITSASSIFTKTLVTTFAQTLVVFLVTNASPDAFSLGSIMGLMHSASVFRGLAVAGTGVAFILGDDPSSSSGGSSSSIQTTNYTLWVTLAIVAVAGAGLAYFVQDRPRVNRDYMAESLKWEICYESGMDAAVYCDEMEGGEGEGSERGSMAWGLEGYGYGRRTGGSGSGYEDSECGSLRSAVV